MSRFVLVVLASLVVTASGGRLVHRKLADPAEPAPGGFEKLEEALSHWRAAMPSFGSSELWKEAGTPEAPGAPRPRLGAGSSTSRRVRPALTAGFMSSGLAAAEADAEGAEAEDEGMEMEKLSVAAQDDTDDAEGDLSRAIMPLGTVEHSNSTDSDGSDDNDMPSPEDPLGPWAPSEPER